MANHFPRRKLWLLAMGIMFPLETDHNLSERVNRTIDALIDQFGNNKNALLSRRNKIDPGAPSFQLA